MLASDNVTWTRLVDLPNLSQFFRVAESLRPIKNNTQCILFIWRYIFISYWMKLIHLSDNSWAVSLALSVSIFLAMIAKLMQK